MKIKKGSKWLCIKDVGTVCKKGIIYESDEDYSILGEDDVCLWDPEEDVVRNHRAKSYTERDRTSIINR